MGVSRFYFGKTKNPVSGVLRFGSLTWCLLGWCQANNRRLSDPSDMLPGGYCHSVSEWGGACWADTGICCGPPWLFLVTNPEGRHPSVHHTCWNIHSATAHNSPKLGTTISHWERTTHRHALQMSLTYIERKMPSTERHRSIYAKHKRQLSVEKPGEVNWLWTMERIWIFP